MCRSTNDSDGPRTCSSHGRTEFSKTGTAESAVNAEISSATTALAEKSDTAESESGSHLGQAEGSYSNIDRNERVSAMLEDLKSEVANLGTGEAWKSYLDVTSKFHNYSFNNRMLIALQTDGKARHVAGFKKWKEFGRSVNKGSKAIHILAPVVIRDKDDIDEKTGKPREKVVGFKSASVFADYQTSGDPLPQPPVVTFDRLSGEAPEGMHSDLDNAITKHGFTVHTEDLGENGPDGKTDFVSKRVTINSRYSSAHQSVTKAHELAHIEMGHGEKSAEYHSGPGGSRPTMEVEAESAAWVIGKHYGLESKESFSYIDGWAHGNPDNVAKTADRVGKACERILSGIGK